jgi:hypothetical protein
MCATCHSVLETHLLPTANIIYISSRFGITETFPSVRLTLASPNTFIGGLRFLFTTLLLYIIGITLPYHRSLYSVTLYRILPSNNHYL